MMNFNKLVNEKILKYLYKNYQNIDFDNIDKDIFFKKITGLNFLEKEELILAVSNLFFEDLDKNFLNETKANINKIKNALPKAVSNKKLKNLVWLNKITSRRASAPPILFLLTRVVFIYINILI